VERGVVQSDTDFLLVPNENDGRNAAVSFERELDAFDDCTTTVVAAHDIH
jgi:hypothetical protein